MGYRLNYFVDRDGVLREIGRGNREERERDYFGDKRKYQYREEYAFFHFFTPEKR